MAAATILGVQVRQNLNFRDGFFINDEQHQLEIIKESIPEHEFIETFNKSKTIVSILARS